MAPADGNANDASSADEPEEKGILSTSTVKILHIAHVLQKKALFLTGGKDKEDHPLIFCAQGVAIESISSEDFKSTITFIEQTASLLWQEIKFVVVVNRQNSKWANVKTILQYLELFPEGRIHHILLLKPQGFFQKHFSSNDAKLLERFVKHEVVVLENQSMLQDYVGLDQLTDEYGGYYNFSVVEWVEYSTAVERFQDTCHKIKIRLGEAEISFSSRDPFSSTDVIETQSKQQAQLVEDIKDDIRCTVEISDTLSPIVNKPLSYSHRTQSPLERYNSAQLQVCTDQLMIYSSDLEKLWLDQKIYHEQAKEVCKFEERFGQLSISLLQITSILESRTDIGDTLTAAQDLFDELDDFELKRKQPYDEMMELKEKGTAMLVLFGSFAHESIKIRLDETKVLCKDFEVKLEARRNLLQISLDVFQCLDKLESWCKSGIDLLASQPVEAFNTEEGAKQCLAELDKFMKNGQGINMKKMNQLNMLCKKLQNKMIDAKVQEALTRIEEVKVLLEKREASLKKVAIKPVRPVQPVKAMVFDKDVQQKKSDVKSPKTPTTPTTPTISVNKKEIEVVVLDNLEKYKRNKTFRKSLRMSFKRPVSSPAQLQMAEYEEDPENRRKIRQVITELINTEHDYVNDLSCVLEGYFVAFDDERFDIPSHLRAQKLAIFGNIEEIYQFHSGQFLEELETCKTAPYLAGQVFMDKKEEFQLYATYCKNKPKSEELRRELRKTTFLNECQKRLGHQLNLDSYLLKPIQRVTKYRLLLSEMLKCVSKKNPAHADIMDALHTMKKVLRYVNDVMHSTGLVGFLGNLDEQGKLLLQDSFTVWESKKNAIKQFTKLGAKHRQVFLFEKSLIFSKREYENGKELGTYQYKKHIKTAAIGVTEVVKGDECKFEVYVHGKNEVYYMLPKAIDIKNNWLAEIRKILMSQFEGAKESKSRLASSSEGLSETKMSTEEFQKKLSQLDPTLRGSTPILSDIVAADSDRKMLGYNLSMKRASSASNMIDAEDSDGSVWSDSEFDDDDFDGVEGNEQAGLKKQQSTETTFSTEDATEIGVNTFCAIADYTAVEDSEISFQAGALINLIKEGDGGWWYCKHLETLKEGWAPSGYMELYVVDITESNCEEKKSQPTKPSKPSPRRRLETTV